MSKTEEDKIETSKNSTDQTEAPEVPMEEHIAYKPDLVDAILNYLSNRPWIEVNRFIEGLQRTGYKVKIPATPLRN